jgi:hypothetical protein
MSEIQTRSRGSSLIKNRVSRPYPWIDGKKVARTIPQINRPDVAMAYKNQTLEKSGWRIAVSAPAAKGRIVINAVNNRGAENFLRPAKAGLMDGLYSSLRRRPDHI